MREMLSNRPKQMSGDRRAMVVRYLVIWGKIGRFGGINVNWSLIVLGPLRALRTLRN